MRIERFESVESYSGMCAELYRNDRYFAHHGGSRNWDAGVSALEATRRATNGDPSLVKKYTNTVDELVSRFTIRQEMRSRYVPSVAGSRVSIPDYLAGSPFTMRKRMPSEVQVRNVNIYVGIVCAAAIPAEMMIKRGSTILALLEFLQLSQVSVNLSLLVETHGRTDGDLIQIIKVQSQPLNLSTAGFAIAHPAFARHLTYDMARKLDGFNGGWPESKGWMGENPSYEPKLAKAIGMEEHDIYVPPPTIAHGEIFDQPDVWLEKRIQVFSGKHD